MSETMMNWDDLRLFLAVARGGGLANAARSTGKSAPTLGRRMAALERATGNELFRRLARGYELTEAGAALFERVTELEQNIAPMARAEGDRGLSLVKVSAGSWMTYALCQQIKRLSINHSTARIRFIAAEAVLDISRRETTIGIRNSRPEQANLVCRKLGRVRFAGYAKKPAVTTWVHVKSDTPSSRWLANEHGGTTTFEVTSARNALDLALAGGARALLPTFVGDNVRGLVRVTSTIAELSHDQWLVTHPDDRYRDEVRSVLDGIYAVAKALH